MGPDLSARLEKSHALLRTVLLIGIAAIAIHLAMILWATLSLHIALRWSETDPMDLDMPGVRWGLALFLFEAVVLGLVVYRFLRWLPRWPAPGAAPSPKSRPRVDGSTSNSETNSHSSAQ